MSVPIIDPYGIAHDPHMPFLARALDPLDAQQQLARSTLGFAGESSCLHLRAIRVTRYKPGRRCLVEYDLEIDRPTAPPEHFTLIGKARARGLDQASYQLHVSLWNKSFPADSADGISVPEPMGIISTFQMWLQRKVPGIAATQLLPEAGGVTLAQRIAETVHKLHRAGIPPRRRHTMADELRILHERLAIVAQRQPRWEKRLARLLSACDRLGAATPEPQSRGIHRDFYPDQVVVDGSRLYLVDFDLYCEGDPGLDIGNFLGHLTEQGIRTLGRSDALARQEEALEERFVELAGEVTRAAVQAYTILTLVRHISLSMQFPERRSFTESLLELCEQRLGRYGQRA